ncbi:MAG TPA: FAD-binding and (Fe-S)-binding domain-containing protein [Acidobacteriaceae bacterium]|jgi:FAD/FMN-containing dehydrogenase/Fe-S oxidoreductase|nr:FAD-binding and (Fe-S)-binding domain-containing protein [Acidobacteriaceae bacterium]
MGATDFKIISNARGDAAGQSFSAAQSLETRLRASIRGSVRFDLGSRALYATDASNYRQVPIGVVLPQDADDVKTILAICREFGAPVLSRGGGTSLAGQCCNVAVVLDFSKYLQQILSLDPAEKLARVQPGIVLDRVREAAEVHHLTFAPDPATHNRCTIGGMIGNNSCGVHALMGGKTVDNIHSMRVLLYDGTELEVGATSEEELAAIIRNGGRRGEIYAALRRIRDQYASLIRQRFPKIPRRVSGYNLDELLPENGFHVARALVGSEGTCVTVTEATLQLRDSPPHRVLVGLGFADAFIAADHVPFVLQYDPIGLEGFDELLVEFMRRKQLAVDDISLLPHGRGHLLVEFGAWSSDEAIAKAHAFLAACQQLPSPPSAQIYSAAEARRVWHVRESALGATVFVPGEPHGWEGWEDSAVPVDQLGRYLRDLDVAMQRYGYRTPLYGHFGQGCVHMRINFDLESEAGIRKFRSFLDEATDIVLRYGGSLSGEHGDGQARAALLPKMFGPELMQAFREFKSAWDPTNKMNPGKLIDPVAVNQPEDNLRLGAGFQFAAPSTHFQFLADGGSLANAATRCVGVGACRKIDSGTMCPSFMATQEEQHSTRGRAHLLWEMLQGELRSEGWKSEAVKDALDLCLSCKACKNECPVNVDVATYKAEFLAHYYAGRLRPLHAYAFGWMDQWARLASVMPQAANFFSQNSLFAGAMKSILGVAPQRTLPAFAPQNFRRQMQRRAPTVADARPQAFLWADTWNNYFHPQTMHAAHAVLDQAGFSVQLPRKHLCCGRPLYDFGMLDRAKRYLQDVLETLAPQLRAKTPIVVLEPSCATVFRDELRNLFPNDPRAEQLAQQTYLLSEFLVQRAPHYRPPSLAGKKILLHGHCHQKTLMKEELALLSQTEATVQVLDSGCCGMAGPFGFEKDKYEVSTSLAERVLLPAVRNAEKDTVIVTNGFSCREQIAQMSPRRAAHLAQVLQPGPAPKP